MDEIIIRSFGDNYLYLLQQGASACAIDPSAAEPVLRVLEERRLGLGLILNTHHHFDHTGGNLMLKRATGCEIVSGSRRTTQADRIVRDGDTIRFGALHFHVLAAPGHTRDGVCFYLPGEPGALFTGDTLFCGGCGRVLEGAPEDLYHTLQRLALLPDETLIYCGHEYALKNYAFALHAAPNRESLARRSNELAALLRMGRPGVPSTLGLEKQTNLFLQAPSSEDFADLRRRKDEF